MSMLSEPQSRTDVTPDPAAHGDHARTNTRVLHLVANTQRVMIEEMAFAVVSMFDRMAAETHLFAEFAGKLAEAHSVHDWGAMVRECSRHQLEFMRRDCDRLLKHGERLTEAASNLLENRG